jgi:indolepyruvate decarboxylase
MPEYSVSNYLLDRLAALGAQHIFGVPGNYNAQFLFAAQNDGRLTYVGTTSELEAGYAADAYSRMKRIGVACVTYGVGSFSLYNAIAGAFVERCPVVLINGTANADKARQLASQGVLFAHAIDTLRTDELIFQPITADRAVIRDPRDAPAQIDRVLRACVKESRPVYLEIPDRIWDQPCEHPANPPADAPLAPLPLGPGEESDVQRATEAAVEAVLERAAAAKSPVLWGGEALQRFGLQAEFEKLVKLTGWAYTTTLLGKGLIAETNEHFIGVYDSAFAPAGVKKVVEGTDCLIALGTILSDFYGPIVSAKFSQMILAAGDAVRLGEAVIPNVPLQRFVPSLVAAVEARRPKRDQLAHFAECRSGFTLSEKRPPAGFDELISARAKRRKPVTGPKAVAASRRITWDSFFETMRKRSWKGWRILVDTSVALFPAAELLIEEPDHFIAQTAWLSIGYTTGAVVGASFAATQNERVVAFAGDGGFQMVPQSLSTLARAKLPTVVFVFANGLYGIEQYLVDKTYYGRGSSTQAAFFNELAMWDYESLAKAFHARGATVNTAAELERALELMDGSKDAPLLIAVNLDPHDLPEELRATIEAAAATDDREALAGLTAAPPSVAPTVADSAFN